MVLKSHFHKMLEHAYWLVILSNTMFSSIPHIKKDQFHHDRFWAIIRGLERNGYFQNQNEGTEEWGG